MGKIKHLDLRLNIHGLRPAGRVHHLMKMLHLHLIVASTLRLRQPHTDSAGDRCGDTFAFSLFTGPLRNMLYHRCSLRASASLKAIGVIQPLFLQVNGFLEDFFLCLCFRTNLVGVPTRTFREYSHARHCCRSIPILRENVLLCTLPSQAPSLTNDAVLRPFHSITLAARGSTDDTIVADFTHTRYADRTGQCTSWQLP